MNRSIHCFLPLALLAAMLYADARAQGVVLRHSTVLSGSSASGSDSYALRSAVGAQTSGVAASSSYRTSLPPLWGVAPRLSFQLTGGEGWRTLALPKAGLPLGGRGPGYLAPLHTAGYVGADADQRNRRGTANVFLYDEPSGTLVPPRREDAVASGEGFWVYVRADDVPYGQPGVQGGFPKTLDASGGTAVAGPFTFGLSYSAGSPFPGVNLVGNPYDEAIDWDDAGWTKTDVSGTVYVWDPAYNGGDYRTWNGTTGDLADGVIPAGQGFHVEATSPGAALAVSESAKTGEAGFVYGKTSVAPGLSLRLTGEVAGEPRESAVFMSPSPEASLGLDALDGRRLASGGDALRLYAVAPEGDALAIAALPSDAGGEMQIPLHAEALASGAPADAAATLSWEGDLPDGWSATLRDAATGQSHDLLASGTVALRVRASGALTHTDADRSPEAKADAPPPVPQARPLRVPDAKRSDARFTLVLSPGDGAAPEAAVAVGEAYPNPASGSAHVAVTLSEAGPVRVEVYDALGRRVAVTEEALVAGAHRVGVPVGPLGSGTYVVRVSVAGAVEARRLTVVR